MPPAEQPRNTGIKLYKEDDEQLNKVIEQGLKMGFRLNQQEALWAALHGVKPKEIPEEVFERIVRRRRRRDDTE